MDAEHAASLLATERERIERAIATLTGEGPIEADGTVEPGDRGDEGLYQDEYDEGRLDDLKRQLDAVERAEQRLADGTYGISIESGEPIPDGRLEAVPTAERTIEEQQRFKQQGG